MSHPQCGGLAREVVLWQGFDDQNWVLLAGAPLPAAAIGTIALPRRILGGRIVPSAVQCVGLAREVVLWHGFDDQSWWVLAVASARRCDWDNRPP